MNNSAFNPLLNPAFALPYLPNTSSLISSEVLNSARRTPHSALAQVVLPLPLDQAYSYSVPEEMQDEARVGCRVLVPFGPRRLTGLIVARGGAVEEGVKLKPILDVLDEAPSFTDEMLRLTRWIADYYVCGWGEAVKAALPTGTEIESKKRVYCTGAPPGAWAEHPTARAVLRYLNHHGEASLNGLRQQVDDVPLAFLRRLERDGLVRIETELSKPKVRIKREKHVRLASPFRHPGAVKDLKTQLRGEKQAAVLDVLADYLLEGVTEPRQADVLARAGAPSSSLKSLAGRGIVEVIEKEVIRSPLGDLSEPAAPPNFVLNEAQRAALERIGGAVQGGRFETFLLHGITGSGKTEVYIAALKETLAQGRTGIILVPEIALTPQTVQRFRAHFGDRIAVLHSRMSMGERYDAWRHLRGGRFQVVIGPRSAVLAPLSNVGLIVVDEEHEQSYKQYDPAPRYHARDVAVMRAFNNEAVCVLGSATPSLESYLNARRGKYTLLCMPERVPVPGRRAASLPDISVVDLRLEWKKHRLDGAVSETLQEAIEQRLARQEQVILLQNRRGYAPVLECRSCGFAPLCFDCSVTLTYHKAKSRLRCHYCGRTKRLPPACPKCGADDLAMLGAGTQRVEEELARLFPAARLLRMDLDTTTKKNAHRKLLDRFGRGEADILLGTQMVAKGLDFGRVTLVGVVDADVGMLLPDFRAEERTFQLLTQVAGRAGRARLPGEVLLQTRNPDHPVFRHTVAHDYAGFVEAALEERRVFGYPPYGRIVGVEFRGPDEDTVQELGERWTDGLKKEIGRAGGPALEVLGPEPAFIGRIKRQYRYHTLVKAPRNHATPDLQDLLRRANAAFGSLPHGYRLAIDVDAVGLF